VSRLPIGLLAVAVLMAVLPPGVTAEDLGDSVCFDCHADEELETARDRPDVSVYVSETALGRSVHNGVACISCHADIDEIPHPERLAPVDCGICHDDAAEVYTRSIHGLLVAEGDQDAPRCAGCHGTHDVLPVEVRGSRVTRLNVVRVCAGCHAERETTERHEAMPPPETIKAYATSVHGRGLYESGLSVSAVCTDCHGAHTVTAADDPRSPAYRANIPALCGRCHPTIAKTFEGSVHGEAVARKVEEAPVCTDCHGEHTISAASDPTSAVAPRNVATTCASCHEEEGLADKFGLPKHRYRTYLSSYHGLVNRYGRKAVANCASCHGVHDIRPSDDPKSSIHPANLAATCSSCHPGKVVRPDGVKIHVEGSLGSSRAAYYLHAYTAWLIGAPVLGLLIFLGIRIRGWLRKSAPQ
jgi:5-methylcytosine-specific restriction endonuclease McrA